MTVDGAILLQIVMVTFFSVTLSVITTAFPSSPSATPTTLSTHPSITHIPIVIPTPAVVTSISATMAN